MGRLKSVPSADGSRTIVSVMHDRRRLGQTAVSIAKGTRPTA